MESNPDGIRALLLFGITIGMLILIVIACGLWRAFLWIADRIISRILYGNWKDHE